MEEITRLQEHSLTYSKNQLLITGVKEVLSFEDKEVALSLEKNSMVIKGNALSVAELNLKSGNLRIDGEVESIAYSRQIEKLGLIKRLFK